MHSNKNFRLIAVLALALAGMAVVASQAVAHDNHRGDRQARLDGDKDGASNRCEIQASLDPAKADTDDNGTIDGLEDSDGDGANNAAESKLRSNCGVANKRLKVGKATIKSYSAEDGLVLTIGKRGVITAKVSEKLVCEQDEADDSPDNSASVSRSSEGEGGEAGDDRGERGGEPESGDDRGGERRGERGDESGDDRGGDRRDDRGEDRRGNEDDENDTVSCTTADFTEGASVLRAKVKNGVLTRIEMASADEGNF